MDKFPKPTSSQHKPRFVLFIVPFLLVYFVFRVFLITNRYFDTDEFEHLHAAWCLSQRLLIYRDFFEHHGPLFPVLLTPIFLFVRDPIFMVWVGRVGMLILWIWVLVFQWKITRQDQPRVVGILSVLFLMSFTTSAEKSLEIRPDTFATLLMMMALFCIQQEPSRKKLFFVGLLLGVSFLMTPKSIYGGVGVVVGFFAAWELKQKNNHLQKMKLLLFCGVGFFIPLLLTGIYFYSRGAWNDFYQLFFLFNLHFPSPFSVWTFLAGSLKENPLLWSFSLIGLIWNRKNGPMLMGWILALGGLFRVPVPYRQYYLFLAPFMSYFSALASVGLFNFIRSRQPKFFPLALGIFCLGLVWPFTIQLNSVQVTNAQQTAEIRCIERSTSPSDQIFDVWTGFSFFRPHAYFVWMLHDEIRRMLIPELMEKEIIESLKKPSCRALIAGEYFQRLSPAVKDYARKNYHSSECKLLYLRNEQQNPL